MEVEESKSSAFFPIQAHLGFVCVFIFYQSSAISALPINALRFVLSALQPIKLEHPVNMENLQVNDGNGQSYGYVLYETVVPGGGRLYSQDHVRDRAQVKNTAKFCQ